MQIRASISVRTYVCLWVAIPLSMMSPARAQPSSRGESPRHKHVVIVKPIIVCDDASGERANASLPAVSMEPSDGASELELLYLQPAYWDNTSALDGRWDANQISNQGKQDRIFCSDPRVLNLVFVRVMPDSPVRETRTAENIAWVALPSKSDLDQGNAIVAQAIRSAFARRRDASRGSTPYLDHFDCHSLDEARRMIVDESWEPYLSGATDNFLRFCIGLSADTPIPANPVRRLEYARPRYVEKALEFTSDEIKILERSVNRLSELVDEDWPAVARLPWHFVKVDSTFCSGLPHTRGLAIYLTAGAIQGIAFNDSNGLALLLHEKLHVIQRLNPARFEQLYRAYKFEKIRLADGELERVDVGQNPDAFRLDWALRLDESPSMYLTRFRKDTSGRLRFTSQYRLLNAQADATFTFGEPIEKSAEFQSWQQELGLRGGLEHPNELSAYLSTPIFRQDYLESPGRDPALTTNKWIDLTRKSFRDVLSLVDDRDLSDSAVRENAESVRK